jgi:hypothetical protein
MLIKQNIKATLESFHEDIRIENKLEKKGEFQILKWYPCGIHYFHLHKKTNK